MTILYGVIFLAAGMLLGMFALLGFIFYRMMSNEGWDDSNITNAIRLLAHVTLHSEDFGHMWYITKHEVPYKRPFHYVGQDELSEVVDSRP
jgi:hypothetical protein